MENDFYNSIVVSDTMAYLANGRRGLGLINVAQPETPTFAGDIQALGYPNGVVDLAVIGTMIYYPDGDLLGIVDASNPLSPTSGYVNEIMYNPAAVAAAGHYVYLVSNRGLSTQTWGMHIFDASDPLNAQYVGGFFSPPEKPPFRVVVSGKYAYLFGSNDKVGNVGLTLVDITNPMTPTQVGYYETPNNVQDIAVVGNLAFIVDGGLHIVRLSNPATSVVEAGLYNPLGAAYSRIAVRGNRAYILDILDGLHVLDVSEPAFPFEVGFYPVEQGRDVTVDRNDNVYVVTRDSLFILRFAPPSTMILPGGGSLTSASDTTTYVFPAATFTEAVFVTHTARLTGNVLQTGSLADIGHMFGVNAVYSNTGQSARPTAGKGYTLTVHFTEAETRAVRKDSLALYYWDLKLRYSNMR
ncbi:MAG: hypothetical protein JXA21_13520 [Anaerolineae bacterium]|nr:hypothetical protein [Anaerolineae bacterium]